ncbi:type VI-C CRISPR-associated RNA-guided ribonuclease Cas13c [Tissierella praeacuta]|uniref:type VI-C CRISPR-associated RNA-guided ribonuclease Cas13c n=1 Tax=Tissierella praeacuta TaxID=43131 RepID=UPI0028AE0888|nr:type VI-C CRISPR-associated RNA-guided ribonuclease Cas13c [Tissierella praeacuta]
MSIGDEKKLKPNKSSIIRVMISNFDDKQIKEIKVLYNKQGGVDVIRLNGTEPDEKGRMKFNFNYAYNRLEDEKTNSLEEMDEQSFFVTTNEDITELYITKKHKMTGEIIKKYTLHGKYIFLNSNKTKVIVSIVDNIDHSVTKDLSDMIRSPRSLTQDTNRVLLDTEVMKNYRQIICSDLERIDETIKMDSQEIYKINRFLSYRSDMIVYYQMINNFLLHYDGEEGIDNKSSQDNSGKDDNKNLINEIWQYEDKKDDEKNKIVERSYRSIEKSINQFILNHNNKVEKDKKGEKIDISQEMIEEDLRKILMLFSKLRHSMVHYNYEFYQALYSGKDFVISSKNDSENRMISQLLDLNIFKELSKIKLIKDKDISNYLDKNTTVHVLGQNINAMRLLDIYRDICESKNGFNKFINAMITISGEEDREYKEKIIEHFNKKIDDLFNYLKKLEKKYGAKRNNKRDYNSLMQTLVEQQKLKEWFGGPYVYDIHSSKRYKELYIERKKLVDRHSKLFKEGLDEKNKKELTKINVELSKLNSEMKEMTKLNSKYRLQYKLQLAFGFILEEFDLNIDTFINDFDKDKDLIISNFMKKRDIYLNRVLDRGNDRLKNIVKEYKFRDTEDIFCNDRNNNLAKLYILMYILLPVEIRGDFLGFVKKNYYDMKHVDFIDREDKDTFFHDLRLFEKNIRKLEVINYSLSSGFLSKEHKADIEEKLNKFINRNGIMKLPENITIDEFNKSLILPIMKNYQIIFKLLNDIEISALFKIAKDKNITFKQAIDEVKNKDKYKNINFSQVMKMALNKGGIYQIRNNISHINMKQLYIDPLNSHMNNRKDIGTISEQIEKVIDVCITGGLTGKELNKNIINDYYMKKEKLVFNLKLRKQNDTVSIDLQEKNKEEEFVFKKYGLDYKDGDINIIEVMQKVNKLEEELKSIKETSKEKLKNKETLFKDISLINGVTRKNINFKIKEIVLDIIRMGEIKRININIYYKSENYNKNTIIKFKYTIDGENKKYYFKQHKISDVDLELKNKSVRLTCHKDKDPKKNKQTINLESNYIQNVKFIIS